MGDLNLNAKEWISSLMDGDLPIEDRALAFDSLMQDPQAMRSWHAYQVVGDVMRSPELAPLRDDFAFLEKLQQRLGQETVGVRSEFPGAGQSTTAQAPYVVAHRHQPESNASVFRWKAVAGLSFAALLGVVVSAVWIQSDQRNGPEVASLTPANSPTSAVVVMDASAGLMLRDPRLDELMAAHRQLGGHSALQVPAGFLRNATYEGTGR